MANVLDLRRRIRSVKNTRQITKAMKMVSAAKLRRAQERALAARPYARMIASVLESLRRRADLVEPGLLLPVLDRAADRADRRHRFDRPRRVLRSGAGHSNPEVQHRRRGVSHRRNALDLEI